MADILHDQNAYATDQDACASPAQEHAAQYDRNLLLARIAAAIDSSQGRFTFSGDDASSFPRQIILIANYLGHGISYSTLLRALGSDPATDGLQKLLLVQLASKVNLGKVNPSIRIDPILVGLSGEFIEAALRGHLSDDHIFKGEYKLASPLNNLSSSSPATLPASVPPQPASQELQLTTAASQTLIQESSHSPNLFDENRWKYLGIDPDLKLVADEVHGVVSAAPTRIASLVSIDDLVYLAGSCIVASRIHDTHEGSSRKAKAVGVLADLSYSLRNLVKYMFALHAKQSVDEIVDAQTHIEFLNRRKSSRYAEVVAANIKLYCSIARDDLREIAYSVEKRVSAVMNTEIYSTEGLIYGLAEKLTALNMLGLDKKVRELLIGAGIIGEGTEISGEKEEDLDKGIDVVVDLAVKQPYRGILPSVDGVCNYTANASAFFAMVASLPERVCDAKEYWLAEHDTVDLDAEFHQIKREGREVTKEDIDRLTQEKKVIRVRDTVVVHTPAFFIRYMYGGADYTPYNFPPGTLCEVVKLEKERVTVKRLRSDGVTGLDNKWYAFHPTEVGRQRPQNEEEKTDREGAIATYRAGTESQSLRMRTKAKFLFEPERYEDLLRHCVYLLHISGHSIAKIQEMVDPRKNGIIDFISDHACKEKLAELVPGTNVPITEASPLPESCEERVAEILRRHPIFYPFSLLGKYSSTKAALVTASSIAGVSIEAVVPELTSQKGISGREFSQEKSLEERSLIYLFSFDTNIPCIFNYLKSKDGIVKYIISHLIAENCMPKEDEGPYASIEKNHARATPALVGDCTLAVYKTLLAIHSVADALETLGETSSPEDKPLYKVSYDPSALLGLKIFKGLSEGADIPGAAKYYMSQMQGYEPLVARARNVPELRYMLAAKAILETAKAPEEVRQHFFSRNASAQEIFFESLLSFVDYVVAGVERTFTVKQNNNLLVRQ